MNILCIIKLSITYRKTIAQRLLYLINYRLVYLELITVSTNNIYLITVLLSLRRIILNSIHASPATAYMEEYRMLYRLKL